METTKYTAHWKGSVCVLTLSLLKTPPIETMGWGWPKLPLQMWILHSFDSIAHGAIH